MAAAGEALYLGVDAGATRCRLRLLSFSAHLIAEREGPSANAYVDFGSAVAVAREVVGRTIERAGSSTNHTSCIRLGLGVAGVSNAGEAGRFAAAFEGFAEVRVVDDAVDASFGGAPPEETVP